MIAKSYTCRVLDNTWITPTVFRLRFQTLKKMPFQPGQFVSVVVPGNSSNLETVKRCYSLASAPIEATKSGYYELCVKYVNAGRGTAYLASLSVGADFQVYGPYGHMQYHPVQEDRSVCFISTGTGIAPLRSIICSGEFQSARPKDVLNIVGVRTEDEVLYAEDFSRVKVRTIYAVSKPSPTWNGFRGRVTDFLQTLPSSWNWYSTDFYICGSGEMVNEVSQFLVGARGVSQKALCKEAFTPSQPAKPNSKKEGQPKTSEIISLKIKQVA